MTKHTIRAMALGLTLCLGSGCAPILPPPGAVDALPPVPPARRQFAPGETARYNVHMTGTTVAQCTFSLERAELDGVPCVAMRYDVRSAGLAHALSRSHSTGTTFMDPVTLLPLRSEKQSEKSRKRKGMVEVVI